MKMKIAGDGAENSADEVGKEIIDTLEQALELRKRAVRKLHRLISSKALDGEQLSSIIDRAFDFIPPNEVTQKLVAPYTKTLRWPTHVEQQLRMVHFKKLLRQHGLRIAPGGNDKLKDYEFAKRLGVAVPQVFQSGVPFDELLLEPERVVKPLQGAAARNVFLVRRPGIVEARTGEILEGARELRQLVDERGAITRKWMSEELIIVGGAPSNDYKVYTYYGEVGLVLEIERWPTVRHCWHDPRGGCVEGMMQADPAPFPGTKLGPELLDAARKISLETPTPFLRVDFFRDEAGECVLGEITPHPGRYAGGYTPELDFRLGEKFFRAEARLFADMLAGKPFEAYRDVYNLDRQ